MRYLVVSGDYGASMRALLDLVAPVVCVRCRAQSDGDLCVRCAEALHVIEAPICRRCGYPLPAQADGCTQCRGLDGFRRARSLLAFAEPARSLTLALKRRGRRVLALSMGAVLADVARLHGLGAEVVTYVPAGRRARRRGFDHAELLARSTAHQLELPMRRLLDRRSDGPRQADVSFVQRRANVRGRFAARPVSSHVLLIDDVFTTGATVEVCALALLERGARSVDVLTWARTLRLRAT